MNQALALCFIVVVAASTYGQNPAREDLALHARVIMRKHCAGCHDGSRGEFSVADRKGFDRPARPFVIPNQPGQSYLMELIEDGSMPPGNQPRVPTNEVEILKAWIGSGASGYPRVFDDAYALESIRADLAKTPATDRPHQRYVSLAHLVTDETTTLQPRREALGATLKDHSKTGAPVSVDPAGTVFRLDLRPMGWSEQAFVKVVQKGTEDVTEPSDLNLYDMILLEYPHGRRNAEAAELRQVRPIAFLRGDWLSDEFPKLTTSRELKNWLQNEAKARSATGDATRDRPAPLPPPLVNLKASRDVILPLNALSHPNLSVDPAPFQFLLFETQDALAGRATPKFKVGQRFKIAVQASKSVHLEIYVTSQNGETDFLVANKIQSGEAWDVKPDDAGGYEVAEEAVGIGTITIYASPSPFPRGQRIRDKRFAAMLKSGSRGPFNLGFTDRVVHPFPTDGAKEFDMASIVKKTISIEVTK